MEQGTSVERSLVRDSSSQLEAGSPDDVAIEARENFEARKLVRGKFEGFNARVVRACGRAMLRSTGRLELVTSEAHNLKDSDPFSANA
jgi:hypothetical protein